MNTVNNKRKRASQNKIIKAFIELLQERDLRDITVTEICSLSKLNRSTFYANYLDVYDLADKVKEKLELDVSSLYKDETQNDYNSDNFLKLFTHIKENQIFYNTYFKLGFDSSYKVVDYNIDLSKKYFDDRFIEYHIEFFRSGLNAIIKAWLKNLCQETPEEMCLILKSEYQNKL